ncbi:unnamed protein product [Rotaria sp. Silwood1]|nr:unnamed protein product [Rotaria sp. Silwood1]CAF4614848.1 unnamed protein product [Rotaria sp. Silwood1]
MATSLANRVISYFFIFDFYHVKGSTDEIDLLQESIIYFYPRKEDLMRQKLLDCGEIIGLIQYFQYDLFSSIPKEFNFKKSLVVCQHYGRHCAFLVLSKDRFTSDEANIHFNHILQLFNMLYGTFNHIQSIYPDIKLLHKYLKQTLTPITEYIFNENRSIKNLFSTIDYAPLKENNRQYLLYIKHLLNHLQSKYEIKDGLFAYEKRILYSTLDSDTTFYLQANEIYIPLGPEMKLKNGVSLIRIYIRRSLSLQPVFNDINAKTKPDCNPQISSKPINIIMPLLFEKNETSSVNFDSNSMGDSLSTGIRGQFSPVIQEYSSDSLGETTSFDADRTEDISSPKKTEINSNVSSVYNKESASIQQFSKDESHPIFSSKSLNELLFDSQQRRYQYERSYSVASLRTDKESLSFNDSIDKVTIVPVEKDDYETDCTQEDIICLPPMSSFSNFHRTRQRTISNSLDFNDVEHNDSDHYERHAKWGDIPEKNDETEHDEVILYVQRNSRMTFAGIMEKNLLSEEYLQKLWCLMVTKMADMDREIQIIPTAGEISKHYSDIKFQFNDNTRQAQFDRLSDTNRYYYKTPSSDHACMAVSARTKLSQNSERKMIGLSVMDLTGKHEVNLKDRFEKQISRYEICVNCLSNKNKNFYYRSSTSCLYVPWNTREYEQNQANLMQVLLIISIIILLATIVFFIYAVHQYYIPKICPIVTDDMDEKDEVTNNTEHARLLVNKHFVQDVNPFESLVRKRIHQRYAHRPPDTNDM